MRLYGHIKTHQSQEGNRMLKDVVTNVVHRIVKEVQEGSSLGATFDTIITKNIENKKKLEAFAAKRRAQG